MRNKQFVYGVAVGMVVMYVYHQAQAQKGTA